jgi:hypothetical protein
LEPEDVITGETPAAKTGKGRGVEYFFDDESYRPKSRMNYQLLNHVVKHKKYTGSEKDVRLNNERHRRA